MWIYDFFCCKFGKMLQIHVFRGVRPDYYDITLYLYYVIYGRPRINRRVSSGEWLWLLWILWMIVEDCDPLLNSKWSHLVSTENVILTREQVAVSPTPTKRTWRSFLTTGRSIHHPHYQRDFKTLKEFVMMSKCDLIRMSEPGGVSPRGYYHRSALLLQVRISFLWN